MSMTNREWLYSLDVADLSDWFDAEHVENTNGTSEGARAASDVTQSDAARQSNVSEDSSDFFTDSREKLEADVREFANVYYTSNLLVFDKVIELLDRQAAITRAECSIHVDGDGLAIARNKWREWKEKAQQLELERDNWRDAAGNAHDMWEKVCKERHELQAQVDELREKLGCAIDHAHEIVTLVDMEGNVIP